MEDVISFHPLRFTILCGMLLCPALLHADWRKDLLKERGIALDPASLKKAAELQIKDDAALKRAFKDLGSDKFQEREAAQALLTEAGEGVLDFFDAQEPIQDPEVRIRVAEIRKAVASGVNTRVGPIIRQAAKSLLDHPADPATSGLFYEWFGDKSEDCRKGYRQLIHEGSEHSKPRIANGRLHITGDLIGEHDQRMVLPSKTWPAKDQLPDRFQVSCLMGGDTERAGTWHVGLCVGKLKVLFHPGYRGGGFRYEQVGTHENLSENQNMGFTPDKDELYLVEMTVTRLPKGKVQAKTVVTSPKGKRFESQITIDQEKAGALDCVSLERSGRPGGKAVFDDLRIRILK